MYVMAWIVAGLAGIGGLSLLSSDLDDDPEMVFAVLGFVFPVAFMFIFLMAGARLLQTIALLFEKWMDSPLSSDSRQ